MREEKSMRLSIAGAVLSGAAGLWLAAAPVLGHMDRPWPCLFFGLAILVSVSFLWHHPSHRRGWSVLVILFSASSLFIGTSAVVPSLLGIAGGAFLIGEV